MFCWQGKQYDPGRRCICPCLRQTSGKKTNEPWLLPGVNNRCGKENGGLWLFGAAGGLHQVPLLPLTRGGCSLSSRQPSPRPPRRATTRPPLEKERCFRPDAGLCWSGTPVLPLLWGRKRALPGALSPPLAFLRSARKPHLGCSAVANRQGLVTSQLPAKTAPPTLENRPTAETANIWPGGTSGPARAARPAPGRGPSPCVASPAAPLFPRDSCSRRLRKPGSVTRLVSGLKMGNLKTN